MKDKEPTPREYQEFLSEIRQQISTAQHSAARAVNAALIVLYWDLGRRIVETQTTKAWGDQVIPMLAKDLKRLFPDQTGYSERNLWYMREFWSAYSRPEFLQQAVAELDGVKAGRKWTNGITLSDLDRPTPQFGNGALPKPRQKVRTER